MDTPLSHIKKYPGLNRYCGHCRKDISDSCRQNGVSKPIQKCVHGSRHQYKIILYTKDGKRRTKNLATRDFDEAVKELLLMKASMHGDQGEQPRLNSQAIQVNVSTPQIQPRVNIPVPTQSKNLLECMALYVSTLEGDEAVVPAFRKRVRSKKHVGDVKRTFTYLALALQEAGYTTEELDITGLTEKMMGSFHSYLLTTRELSNRSYNKAMGIISSFYSFLKDEGHNVQNPCIKIPNRAVVKKALAITPEEYEKLLEVVQKPELGTQQVGKETKSFFRPWLRDCFRIAYHTGRRNHELSRMTFDGIHEDENQVPQYIKVADTKVNRQRGIEDDDPNAKHILVPVTDPLLDVIYELGYAQHRGTSRYLIAGDDSAERDTIKDVMTRAFPVYYRHIGSRNLTLKSCRKAYITELIEEIGISDTRMITKHSDESVITNHYSNDEKIASSVAKRFRRRNIARSDDSASPER